MYVYWEMMIVWRGHASKSFILVNPVDSPGWLLTRSCPLGCGPRSALQHPANLTRYSEGEGYVLRRQSLTRSLLIWITGWVIEACRGVVVVKDCSPWDQNKLDLTGTLEEREVCLAQQGGAVIGCTFWMFFHAVTPGEGSMARPAHFLFTPHLSDFPKKTPQTSWIIMKHLHENISFCFPTLWQHWEFPFRVRVIFFFYFKFLAETVTHRFRSLSSCSPDTLVPSKGTWKEAWDKVN